MPRFSLRKMWSILLLAFLIGLSLVSVGWMRRDTLLSWYYVRGLANASESERAGWVQSVVALDCAAVPGLIGCLERDDEQVCANAQAALAELVERWGSDDPRSGELMRHLVETFPRMSGPGQRGLLRWQVGSLVRSSKDEVFALALLVAVARILPERTTGTDTRALALELAAVVLSAREKPPEAKEACRACVRSCLKDGEPDDRIRAVSLAQHRDLDLLKSVALLLNDPVAEVRRVAILAVGPDQEAIHTDELLRSLHDPDPEVRRLCEAALRGPRKLREEHIKLGRLITDDRPALRLQVLDWLGPNSELEPGIWLRRLSHDPAPAVRAAALRVAAEQARVDLTDRIDQMARSDPSPTVCQLARYYLTCPKLQRAAFVKP